jgi:hypothetical protein
MSRVSPIQVGRLILEPIRHFFLHHAPAPQFQWDPDEKKAKIDISMVNDANKELVDNDRQILVDRGGLVVQKTGLSDNLLDAPSAVAVKGRQERRNLLIYQGQARVIIKSRTEGNAEVLTDMVMHILQWSRPHICDVLGFKDFALPMQISPTSPMKPDTECFTVEISVPYTMEEAWNAESDSLKLRDLFINIKAK